MGISGIVERATVAAEAAMAHACIGEGIEASPVGATASRETDQDMVEDMSGNPPAPAEAADATEGFGSDEERLLLDTRLREARLCGAHALGAPPRMRVDRTYPSGDKDGTVAELTFDRPMGRKEVEEYLFRNGELPGPGAYAMPESSQDRVVIIPSDIRVGGRSSSWKLFMPHVEVDTGRMNASAADALTESMGKEAATPPWVPAHTRELIEKGSLPPAPGDPGVSSVRSDFPAPRDGVTVWTEGDCLFWHDGDTGMVEGLRLSDKRVMDIYNRDVRQHVLEEGMPPGAAAREYVKDWTELNLMIGKAFGLTLGGTMGTNTTIGDLAGATEGWSDVATKDWL